MKNKIFLLTIIVVFSLILTACGGQPIEDNAAEEAAAAAVAEAEAALAEAEAAVAEAEADAATNAEEKAKLEAALEAAQAELEVAREEMDHVEITIWTLDSYAPSLDAILDDFHAANPDVTIVPVYNDGNNHRDGLKIAATSKSLPDMWFQWGGTLGGFYAENDLIYDLTDYAAENNWDEKFESAGLNLSTLHGQLAGYPTSLAMVGVYYRADIFDELGIQEPTTFEEFDAILATLKENGYVPLTAAGGGNGWHVMRIVEQLIEHYAGPELHDSMKSFDESFNNEAVAQAFAKFKEWVDAGYFIDGFLTMSGGDAPKKLYSGDAVMVFEGQWFERNVLSEELDNSLFGYFPFPSGGTNRMSAFVEMYQFNKNLTEAEVDAGVRFMDYWYGVDTITANPTNYKYPIPIVGVQIPEANVKTKEMVADIAETGSFTITDQAFPTEVASVLFSVQDEVALGSMTPEEGAAAIQEAIETYLASK
jgi:raffinose/stachyose/melibiose transport system substrate-binding protein